MDNKTIELGCSPRAKTFQRCPDCGFDIRVPRKQKKFWGTPYYRWELAHEVICPNCSTLFHDKKIPVVQYQPVKGYDDQVLEAKRYDGLPLHKMVKLNKEEFILYRRTDRHDIAFGIAILKEYSEFFFRLDIEEPLSEWMKEVYFWHYARIFVKVGVSHEGAFKYSTVETGW